MPYGKSPKVTSLSRRCEAAGKSPHQPDMPPDETLLQDDPRLDGGEWLFRREGAGVHRTEHLPLPAEEPLPAVEAGVVLEERLVGRHVRDGGGGVARGLASSRRAW